MLDGQRIWISGWRWHKIDISFCKRFIEHLTIQGRALSCWKSGSSTWFYHSVRISLSIHIASDQDETRSTPSYQNSHSLVHMLCNGNFNITTLLTFSCDPPTTIMHSQTESGFITKTQPSSLYIPCAVTSYTSPNVAVGVGPLVVTQNMCADIKANQML